MTTVVTSMRFACRRRTAADWTSGNEILLAGEIGYETDTDKFKIGDGVTRWNSISGYFSKTGGSGSAAWGAITGTLTDQTDLVAALALKVPTSRTVNGMALSANITLSASDVGADASGAAAAAQAYAIQRANHTGTQAQSTITNLVSDLALKADLVGGVVPSAQIPAIAITEFLGSVANQAAMLALSGQRGDWCIRTDLSMAYVITGTDPTQLSDWTGMAYPTAPVTSVNGQTGAVTLAAADVGAATAAQGALADSAVQDVAAVIHAATSKATPVDADELGLVDSEASNVLKILTWANLKAALKSYFDGLYTALVQTVSRFTLQTSVPSAASSGEAKLSIRNMAGFALAQIRSESGHYLVFPSFDDPLFRGTWLTTGVTRDYKNMPSAMSSGGTATGATVGGIAFRNLATAATTNSVATDYVNSQTLVTSGGVVNGYLLIIPFRLPDASYGSGATGSDIFVGCINGSVSSTTRLDTAARGAGFSYSTPLSDTNWQFTVRDGGTTNITTTDTGMAFAAQKHYLAMIYAPASGSNTYWCLVNITDQTSVAGSTARKHGTTTAQEIAVLYTRDNVARNIQCNDFWTLMGGGGVTY